MRPRSGVILCLAGCSLATSLDDLGGDASVDGTADTTPGESGSDVAPDTSTVTYHDMTDPNLWRTFDTTKIGATNFFGGAFDGHYLYLAPNNSGVVAQLDTQKSMTDTASWNIFDVASLQNSPRNFAGAVFSTPFVQFAPSGGSAWLPRLDTRAPFADAGSWTTINMTNVDPNAHGFIGGTFDEKYVYYTCWANSASNGLIARFDTTAAFDAGASWTVFDVASVPKNPRQFRGAVFDGRHVYLVPGNSALVAQYDTQLQFDMKTSWATFDFGTMVDACNMSFFGGAFDGRYVYFVPSNCRRAVRYDTQKPFAVGSSWESIDLTGVNPAIGNLAGAGFDGRYIYYASQWAPLVIRFDTTLSFTDTQSWRTIDLSGKVPKPTGFTGVVFDGAEIYILPSPNYGVIAQFDARTPAPMPALPGWNGSFL